jgi:hypothetical protein
MRKIINMQMEFWKTDIADIEFDLQSRDEIPKLLMGLQYIYRNKTIRDKVFKILKDIVPRKSQETGRPGMDLWKILVLGTLRLDCNWDYDKVHEMANNHQKIRQMLGHAGNDFYAIYSLQTIRDNLALLTPEILESINQIVVTAGHKEVMGKNDTQLSGSCDSFVVKTDVHYPTDINLLFDATRKIIQILAAVGDQIGITWWRQGRNNVKKAKKALHRVQKLYRSKKAKREHVIIKEHQEYIKICNGYIFKAKDTIQTLREFGMVSLFQDLRLNDVQEYICHGERQIDQIQRRVVHGEKIPHEEKVFSIFEPHTEWISKGKAGVPQELGLRVCILKDQHGFILHHQVMRNETDDKVTIPMVQRAKEKFPDLKSCSFDKGFYTPSNRIGLSSLLDDVVLPKKGRLSAKDKEIEHANEFIEKRRKHSAVESSINALENHGLDRCLDHGLHGFERYVALSVLARNIQILGHHLQQKELKRQERLLRKAA